MPKLLIALFLSLPAWTLYLTAWAPLWLLGWLLIPIAAYLKLYKKRQGLFGYKVLSWYWLMWVWSNEEDGILAGQQYRQCSSDAAQIVYWTAIRNPTNNLRFTPLLSCKIEPERVRFFGSHDEDLSQYDTKIPQWFFAWQGLYSNIFWQFEVRGQLWRLWLGWKVFPTDIRGVTAYRKHGAGFATQLKRLR